MDTPLVKLSSKELETVYEPSEDSFLLIDALEADLDILKAQKPSMCLEIGSGSGVVITALAMALKKAHMVHYLAVDINLDACNITRRTGATNSVDVEVLQMDLLSCMREKPIFDIIVFNPPYVVTENEEISSKDLLSKTWAGGEHGRCVMERVFHQIPGILSDRGSFYLLIIKENDPNYILNVFEKLNMIGAIISERKIRGEHLYILRFTKSKQ